MYKNKIKVCGQDLICFPVNPETLEPENCGCYDPWAFTDPEKECLETISVTEWIKRQRKMNPEKEVELEYFRSLKFNT